MKNCSSHMHEWMLYLRGDLPEVQARDLSDHPAACPACREKMEEFRTVFELTALDSDFACPREEEILARIRARVAEEGGRPRRSVGRRFLVPVMAAAALVVVISLWVVLVKEHATLPPDPFTYLEQEMVHVAGGSFRMGDIFQEGKRDESPVHAVQLSGFYLGRHEVTVAAFEEFVGETRYITTSEDLPNRAEQERTLAQLNARPGFDEETMKLYDQLIASGGCYWWNPDTNNFDFNLDCDWQNPLFEQTARNPVVCMSWTDAVHFCNWLSSKEGLPVAYDLDTGALLDGEGRSTTDITAVKGYRLPTEAEWEFAAREGGKEVRFGNGRNVARASEINFDAARGDYDYLEPGEYRNRTTPVGRFASNRLGLHDMSGNAWEWVTDCYSYYQPGERVNPCQAAGDRRIMRGGRFGGDAGEIRVFDRAHFEPHNRCNNAGFRVARSL